jgi:hypothetical protein
VDVFAVGLAVNEGVEPGGERSDGIAVALVLDGELGEHRDDVLGSGVVGPEFDGEALGGKIEREVFTCPSQSSAPS